MLPPLPSGRFSGSRTWSTTWPNRRWPGVSRRSWSCSYRWAHKR